MSTRRTFYALAGGVLALGAPAGLLLIRRAGRGLSIRSAIQEMRTDPQTYIYTATSTAMAFALFGGALGHTADRLARLAMTDPLTGLFNARVFNERLRQELGRAARYQEPMSVLIADLDNLKRVNDQFGHAAGNRALRSVATAIRHELREVDLAARVGGDEFVVLAPRTDHESAAALAERLRALVAAFGKRPGGLGLTISIGIASLVPSTRERVTPVMLMAAADERLYQAKRAGRNRVASSRSCRGSGLPASDVNALPVPLLGQSTLARSHARRIPGRSQRRAGTAGAPAGRPSRSVDSQGDLKTGNRANKCDSPNVDRKAQERDRRL